MNKKQFWRRLWDSERFLIKEDQPAFFSQLPNIYLMSPNHALYKKMKRIRSLILVLVLGIMFISLASALTIGEGTVEGVNIETPATTTSGGGGSGNPFDQWLNTSNSVNFASVQTSVLNGVGYTLVAYGFPPITNLTQINGGNKLNINFDNVIINGSLKANNICYSDGSNCMSSGGNSTFNQSLSDRLYQSYSYRENNQSLNTTDRVLFDRVNASFIVTRQLTTPNTSVSTTAPLCMIGSVTGGFYKCSGTGSIGIGYVQSAGSSINSTGGGSVVMGTVNGISTARGHLLSSGEGSLAVGEVFGTSGFGTISARGTGAVAMGYMTTSGATGLIDAGSPGSFAQGYLTTGSNPNISNSSILASNSGAFAQGSAGSSTNGGLIQASQIGSFAQGYSLNSSRGIIAKGGGGSFAHGEDLSGAVIADGITSVAIGDGVQSSGDYIVTFGYLFNNTNARSFAWGYNGTAYIKANTTGSYSQDHFIEGRARLTNASAYNNFAVCYTTGGTLGHCTTAVNSTGGCTCALN